MGAISCSSSTPLHISTSKILHHFSQRTNSSSICQSLSCRRILWSVSVAVSVKSKSWQRASDLCACPLRDDKRSVTEFGVWRLSSESGETGSWCLLRTGSRDGCLRRNFRSFKSRRFLNDVSSWANGYYQWKRELPSVPRGWYSRELGIRCAAGREEDGGMQGKSRPQEGDVMDHYKVLGLCRQATTSAIKSAFRQLARQFHPDVNRDVDADNKFKTIRLAYEVLSDEASRKLYDSTLQDQAKSSRRKQVYQRRERGTWVWSHHNRSHTRRTPYENVDWSPSMYYYQNKYANMESYYHPSISTATFSDKKRKSNKTSSSNKSPKEEIRQRDWEAEWQNMGKEAVLFLWVVSTMWHALGAQTALGLLVGSLALWKDFAVGYRLASGVAWLMGGEKGLALIVALIATTRVFGRAYHSVAAILALALWLGGGALKAVPLPHGAILVLVYKCIQLQSSST